MDGILDLDEYGLHALRAVTDPRSLELVDDEIAAFEDAHAWSGQRADRVLAGHPIAMHGNLRTVAQHGTLRRRPDIRSEEHTSELQSLMRISYAVFCLKKKKQTTKHTNNKEKK